MYALNILISIGLIPIIVVNIVRYFIHVFLVGLEELASKIITGAFLEPDAGLLVIVPIPPATASKTAS